MANYPAYQYQPQNPYWQQPQPMYQAQPYQQQAQPAQEQPLFCRRATNREEVQAYPVDFSGSPMTFIGPGLQTIWVKVFDSNTGGSVVAEYHKAPPEAVQAAQIPTMEDILALQDAIRRQGEEIAQLRASRRRTVKEAEVIDDAV